MGLRVADAPDQRVNQKLLTKTHRHYTLPLKSLLASILKIYLRFSQNSGKVQQNRFPPLFSFPFSCSFFFSISPQKYSPVEKGFYFQFKGPLKSCGWICPPPPQKNQFPCELVTQTARGIFLKLGRHLNSIQGCEKVYK